MGRPGRLGKRFSRFGSRFDPTLYPNQSAKSGWKYRREKAYIGRSTCQ
jgi:hypothetical protein